MKKLDLPTCFFGDCASDDGTGTMVGTVLTSNAELLEHFSTVHSRWAVQHAGAKFCHFCNAFITNTPSFDNHLAGHLTHALSTVSRFGYEGISVRDRIIIPAICPFHIHDDTLPADERCMTMKPESLGRHIIQTHLLTTKQEAVCPGFPDMCTKGDSMDAEQMKQHLAVIHGIQSLKDLQLEKRKPNNKKRKQNNLGEQEDTDKADNNTGSQPLQETSSNIQKAPAKHVKQKK